MANPPKKITGHFNVKTVEGPKMILLPWKRLFISRYRRMLDEGTELPQLIIIDGGKGQLSSALKSLKLLGIDKQVTVIGIAKRLEELLLSRRSVPAMYLDKKV